MSTEPNPASDTAREAADDDKDFATLLAEGITSIREERDALRHEVAEKTVVSQGLGDALGRAIAEVEELRAELFLSRQSATASAEDAFLYKSQAESMKAKLIAIHDLTYPYADGAEGASMHDVLCLQISDIAKL